MNDFLLMSKDGDNKLWASYSLASSLPSHKAYSTLTPINQIVSEAEKSEIKPTWIQVGQEPALSFSGELLIPPETCLGNHPKQANWLTKQGEASSPWKQQNQSVKFIQEIINVKKKKKA